MRPARPVRPSSARPRRVTARMRQHTSPDVASGPTIIEGVSRRPWHIAALMLAMTLGAVGVVGAQSPPPMPEVTPSVPGTVSGTTFGTSGLPLPGVSLWMETELVAGRPGRASSGPDGRYLVTDLSPFNVYSAHARYPVEYAGRSWCLRLAPRDVGRRRGVLGQGGRGPRLRLAAERTGRRCDHATHRGRLVVGGHHPAVPELLRRCLRPGRSS